MIVGDTSTQVTAIKITNTGITSKTGGAFTWNTSHITTTTTTTTTTTIPKWAPEAAAGVPAMTEAHEAVAEDDGAASEAVGAADAAWAAATSDGPSSRR